MVRNEQPWGNPNTSPTAAAASTAASAADAPSGIVVSLDDLSAFDAMASSTTISYAQALDTHAARLLGEWLRLWFKRLLPLFTGSAD